MFIAGNFPKRVDRKVWFMLGMFILVISYIFLGPEQLLYLPDELYVVNIGLILLGLGYSIVLVPSIPELIN